MAKFGLRRFSRPATILVHLSLHNPIKSGKRTRDRICARRGAINFNTLLVRCAVHANDFLTPAVSLVFITAVAVCVK